jgi:hypothetical protein
MSKPKYIKDIIGTTPLTIKVLEWQEKQKENKNA